MRYINKDTKEVLILSELCLRLNASIPEGFEAGDWMPVKPSDPPVLEAGFYLEAGPIEEREDGFYESWVVVAIPPQPEVVPTIISIYQCCAQLMADGLLEVVDAYFEAEDTPYAEKLAWAKIRDVERQSPLANKMAEKLGWDEARRDQFFIAARKIKG